MTDKKTAEAAVAAARKKHQAAEKKANDAHAKWYAAQRDERVAFHELRVAEANPALVDIEAELAAMLPTLRTNIPPMAVQHVDGNPRNNELANVVAAQTPAPAPPVSSPPASPAPAQAPQGSPTPAPAPVAAPTPPPAPPAPPQPAPAVPAAPGGDPWDAQALAAAAQAQAPAPVAEDKPKRTRRTRAQIAADNAAAEAAAAAAATAPAPPAPPAPQPPEPVAPPQPQYAPDGTLIEPDDADTVDPAAPQQVYEPPF